MLGLDTILIFMVLGAVVGFMAGLLGIGGGGIMVPVLTSIFLYNKIPLESVVHIALGTSMASIIVTSASSLLAHRKHQGIIWSVVKSMAPGVLIGTFLATYLVSYISAEHLAIFFACFMAYVAVQMFLDFQPRSTKKIPGVIPLFATGNGIGAISAMVAIGGGTLTVPYLTWHNVSLRKAIGTSAAIGFPIAISGTLGYLINGLNAEFKADFLIGYIYLPAVFAISVISFFTAPLGARLAHTLPIPKLKKIFALFLVLLSVKMVFSIL